MCTILFSCCCSLSGESDGLRQTDCVLLLLPSFVPIRMGDDTTYCRTYLVPSVLWSFLSLVLLIIIFFNRKRIEYRTVIDEREREREVRVHVVASVVSLTEYLSSHDESKIRIISFLFQPSDPRRPTVSFNVHGPATRATYVSHNSAFAGLTNSRRSIWRCSWSSYIAL